MDFKIRGESIQLQQLLKAANVVGMGGEVKGLLADGAILINGVVATERRKQLRDGDVVTVGDETIRVLGE